jgi:hypothetical protein
LGVAALGLRPRRTVAEVLDPRSPVGLWGAARTDEGLLALWSSGGPPVVVRLSDRGPVTVQRVLATPAPGVAVAVAAGGAPSVLGAVEDVRPGPGGISTGHLPESVSAALAAEVDGPLSVAGLDLDVVLLRRAEARGLDGSPSAVALPAIPGGIAAAALRGDGPEWVAVQHPPTPEGDHCSSLTVLADGRTLLEIDDLALAGPASIVGPTSAPLVAVSDGESRARAWHLGHAPVELVSPRGPDEVALHIADRRPIGLRASPAGATLLAHGASGWEVVRDVAGTDGCRRVLAVAGVEPEFLVEVADGVRLVDGEGRVR